jgi:hypothetical protein
MQARNRTWMLGSDPVERCRQRTMAIEGGDGSTLSLDFTTGVLDPRLTFSRASTATFVNSSGYVAWAGANLLRNSNWLDSNPTPTNWNLAGNAATIPATGFRTFTTTTAATSFIADAGISLSQGITYSSVIEVSAVSGSPTMINTMVATASPTNEKWYQDGTLVTSGTVITSGTITYVFTAGSGSFVRCGLGSTGSTVTSQSVTVTKPRVVPGVSINATYYESTTSAAYHAPRFDNALLTSRTNLVLQSNNFSTSPWVQKYGTVATLTSNYTVAGVPDGFSGTATRLQSSVAASGITQPLSLSTVSGKAIVFSLYIKSNTTATQFVRLEDVTGGGTLWEPTPVWQRFQFGSSISITKFGIEGVGAGLDISICGAQVEYVNTGAVATAYIPTTTTEGVVNTTEPRGLLVEGQATNVATNSNALANAGGLTRTYPTGVISPDGTENAQRFTKTDVTTPRFIYPTTLFTVPASTAYTASIWIKYDGYAFTTQFQSDTGLDWGGYWTASFVITAGGITVGSRSGICSASTVTPYPNGWYRCTATITTGAVPTGTNPRLLIDVVGTTGVSVLVYGLQLEAGSGASSYIPTGASQVTRNADKMSMTDISTMQWNQTAGTFCLHMDVAAETNTNAFPTFMGMYTVTPVRVIRFLLNNSSGINPRIGNDTWTATPSQIVSNVNNTRPVAPTAFKYAVSLFNTGQTISQVVNAGTVVTTSGTGTMQIPTRLLWHQDPSAGDTEYFPIHIRLLKYWSTALPDAQLTSITS